MIYSHNIPINDVAEYFLAKIDIEAGDCISNLKLQKLVYYAQGFVLAITEKKLFNEQILAWQHGPVVKELYDRYKENGANCIHPTESANESALTNNRDLKDILDDVYDTYGQFSAWKLRNMTHEEQPWQEVDLNDEINITTMKTYFKTLLV